jgi:hypothetical protein
MVYHPRFENRTHEEFINDIKKGTENEIPYVCNWYSKHAEKHFDVPIKLIYSGIGWNGDFVENGDFSKSDFLLETKNDIIGLEFKDNEKFTKTNFCTFKVHNLKNYVKNNIYILSPTGNDYILITPKEQATILDNIKNKTLISKEYYGFARGKMAIRLYKEASCEYDRIDTYTKIHKGI